ncbi:purine nucleoside [Moniliophthora roreri]|nr:purine nucleoside [Moniliophthora roreri]
MAEPQVVFPDSRIFHKAKTELNKCTVNYDLGYDSGIVVFYHHLENGTCSFNATWTTPEQDRSNKLAESGQLSVRIGAGSHTDILRPKSLGGLLRWAHVLNVDYFVSSSEISE